MDKVSFIGLWDIYRGLLTPTQQEITDMYFNLDLTLSEIADEKGITRQGVSECLKTCKKQLEEYEEKLGFSKRLSELSLQTSYMATDVNIWAEGFKQAHPEFATEVDKLTDIINKDN
ncbi:MAG: DNA-binding protein [Clostridia bacterium]|nr:DNA-binding protein [Clostridia bacterium]